MPKPERLSILTELREQAGLSLTEMAKACGLTGTQARKTVGRWEQGEVTPKSRRRAKVKIYLWDTLRLRKTPEKLLEVWEILVEEWNWDELSNEEWKELTQETRPGLSNDNNEEWKEFTRESSPKLSNDNDVPVSHESWISTISRSMIVTVATALLLVTVILLSIGSGRNPTEPVGVTAEVAVPTSVLLTTEKVTIDELNESQQPTSVPATPNPPPCTISDEKDSPILGVASFDKRGTQQNLRLEEQIFDTLFKLQEVAKVCRFDEVVKNKLQAQALIQDNNIKILIWGGLDGTALVTNIEGLEDRIIGPRSPEEVADITFYTEEYPRLIKLVASLIISQIYFFDEQRANALRILETALEEATQSASLIENNKEAFAKSYIFLGYMYQSASPSKKPDKAAAIEAYEKSIELDPYLPNGALINLAAIYYNSKDYERAENIYTSIINSGESGSSLQARFGRSLALIMQGEPYYEMAVIDFNKVTCDYTKSDSKILLGYVYLSTSSAWLLVGQENQATENFSRSLCYWSEEQRDLVHNHWQKLTQTNPEFSNTITKFTTMLELAPLPMTCEPLDSMSDCISPK